MSFWVFIIGASLLGSCPGRGILLMAIGLAAAAH